MPKSGKFKKSKRTSRTVKTGKMKGWDVEITGTSYAKKSELPQTITKMLTLENIFTYANDEELEAIVHSIFARLCDYERRLNKSISNGFTDKELHEVAKGLRTPQ